MKMTNWPKQELEVDARGLRILRFHLRCEVDRLPTSGNREWTHYMIGQLLSSIATRFGHAEAKTAIRDFGLDRLGWQAL